MKKLTILIILSIFCFLSCNEDNSDIKLDEKETILLNTDYNQWLNKEYGYESWQPEQKDLNTLKSIIDEAIDNNKFDFIKKPIKNNFKKYYRQYIPYLNEKNERIIKINALCKILELPSALSENKDEFKEMDWRNNYIAVDDGGSCYWEIHINIDKRKLINLE